MIVFATIFAACSYLAIGVVAVMILGCHWRDYAPPRWARVATFIAWPIAAIAGIGYSLYAIVWRDLQ